MLNFLKVKNLAIVENAQVIFSPGLNIITGETGSGKSVLIGALNLILGERADHSAVRNGEKELIVEAAFSLKDCDSVDAILEDAGLPPCEERQLLIRRSVSTSGNGKCWINDSPSTVATLRRLGHHLIDMHGPYDHQSLLSSDFQLSLLDSFGKVKSEKNAYDLCFQAHSSLLAERSELLEESGEAIGEEIDRLSFIVDEIDKAALTEDDGEDLIRRHKEACNASAILEDCGALVAGLSEGEESLFDRLAQIQQKIHETQRILPEAEEWHKEVASVAISIQELTRTITDRMQRIESDPESLANLEARMELVQRMKRKYGPSLDDVAKRRNSAKEKLDRLLSREKRLASLDGEIATAETKLRTAGKILSKVRTAAGKQLAEAITKELKPLGFAQSYFAVEIQEKEPTTSGMDEIIFSFAPNPGEPPMPLKAIASSGEIARVMLATKSVLAEHDSIPLLVFDEIDSNIGGEVGKAVGEKLRWLSQSHQVISITHLPQVAAFGDVHFSVAKHVEGNRTQAEIRELEEEQRAKELARMLGGSDITTVVLAHAQELIASCTRHS